MLQSMGSQTVGNDCGRGVNVMFVILINNTHSPS